MKNEKVEPKKREQKISVSYTIRAFGDNAKKLKEAKMISEEEFEQVKTLHAVLVERWIGLTMKM